MEHMWVYRIGLSSGDWLNLPLSGWALVWAQELLLSGGQDGCIQCHGVASWDVLGSGSFMGTLNSTNLKVNDCQDWVDRGDMEDHPELPSAIRCTWDYLDMIYQLIHPHISGWHCFPGDQVWTKHLLLTIIKLLSGLNQLCKPFFLVSDWFMIDGSDMTFLSTKNWPCIWPCTPSHNTCRASFLEFCWCHQTAKSLWS